jgi:hypothetical protein
MRKRTRGTRPVHPGAPCLRVAGDRAALWGLSLLCAVGCSGQHVSATSSPDEMNQSASVRPLHGDVREVLALIVGEDFSTAHDLAAWLKAHQENTTVWQAVELKEYCADHEAPNELAILIGDDVPPVACVGRVYQEGKSYLQVLNSASYPLLSSCEAMLEAGYSSVVQSAEPREIVKRIGKTQVAIDKLWHSWGMVTPMESPHAEFVMRNDGPRALIIAQIDTSCGCLASDSQGATLDVGKSEAIRLRLSAGKQDSVVQTATVTLIERGTGERKDMNLRVYANQPATMAVTPTSLNFGSVLAGQTSDVRHLRLDEVPLDTFVVKDIKADLPVVWSAETVQGSGGLRSYHITLQLDSTDESPGIHDAEITVVTDSKYIAELPIPYSINIRSLVRAVPSSVSFGTLRVGESVERFIELEAAKDLSDWKLVVATGHDGIVACEATRDRKRGIALRSVPTKPGFVHSTLFVELWLERLDRTVQLPIECVALVRP